MPSLLVSHLRRELKPDEVSVPEYILPPLPNFAPLHIAGCDSAMPILACDGGDEIIQTITPRGNRGDHDAAFCDGHIDWIAFIHFDLVGESFRNPEGETVTPFLQNGFHGVDTLAIPDAAARSKARCPRRKGAAGLQAPSKLTPFVRVCDEKRKRQLVAGASLSAYQSVR
jgi:hypothetical protein